DMGGTSTDVCLVTGGRTEISTEYKIGGLPLGIPMIDIVTVGAGGGSIARVDSGGALRVGPESAGADPGPACYGRGGRDFTVTDANLVLGLLDPETFYGGRMRLSIEATSKALAPLIERLGSTREQVASGVVRLANATMAQAMRLVSVERGHDPRDYTIVAYGGAGPLHAVALAEELSVRSVLVPRNPGLLSAYGLTLADVRQDYLRSHIVALRELEPRRFQELFEELSTRARDEFARYGLQWEDLEVSRSLDMRYEGQAYELAIVLDPTLVRELSRQELIARFKEMHRFRYGYAPSGNDVEIVNFRLTARHPSGSGPFDEETEDSPSKLRVTERNILLGGGDVLCRFYERSSLSPGYDLLGPAVIEEPTSTTYVPSGWRARVDGVRNLVLTPEGVPRRDRKRAGCVSRSSTLSVSNRQPAAHQGPDDKTGVVADGVAQKTHGYPGRTQSRWPSPRYSNGAAYGTQENPNSRVPLMPSKM
ncbi:MAG: hydantoinase/oxoprolinase family protein, partial [Vicinamibacteria bacterium]